MKFIQDTPGNQAVLFPTTLDEIISKYNSVRTIEEFVNHFNLSQLGFEDNKI